MEKSYPSAKRRRRYTSRLFRILVEHEALRKLPYEVLKMIDDATGRACETCTDSEDTEETPLREHHCPEDNQSFHLTCTKHSIVCHFCTTHVCKWCSKKCGYKLLNGPPDQPMYQVRKICGCERQRGCHQCLQKCPSCQYFFAETQCPACFP